MQAISPLYAVTLDGAPFALIRAFDAVEAIDLAFGIYTARLSEFGVAKIAAAEHRQRLAARLANDVEAESFAARAVAGEARLAAVPA